MKILDSLKEEMQSYLLQEDSYDDYDDGWDNAIKAMIALVDMFNTKENE